MNKKYLNTKNLYIFLLLSMSFILLMILSSCTLFGISKNKQHILNVMSYSIDNTEDLVYDGQEKFVKLSLYEDEKLITTISPNEEHPDLELEYENNINAGKASVTIRAKENSKNFNGSLYCDFIILRASSIDVEDAETLLNASNSKNYYEINLTNDLNITKTSLQISSGTTLNLNGHTLDVEHISNNGTINFNTEGSTIFCSYDIINNHSNIQSNNLKSNIYINGKITGVAQINSDINIYYRKQISAYIDTYSYSYTKQQIEPTVVVNAEQTEYDIEYSNNVNIGDASIKVIAKHDSKTIYGEKIIYFKIDPTLQIATNDTSLQQILLDPNNTLIGLQGVFESVEVPSYCTITATNTTINGDLIVNGNLQTNNITVNGKTTNNGTIENISGIANYNGKIENNLTFKNNSTLNIYNELINNGTISNKYGTTIDVFNKTINTKDATISNYGTILFEDETSNLGDIKNEANGIIYFIAPTTSSNNITNLGQIIADFDLDFITNMSRGKYIRRKPITIDDVSINNNIYEYNALTIKPTLYFSNKLMVNTSDYKAETFYVGNSNPTYSPINPGDIDYVITFNKKSTSYTGSITIQYSIIRGTYKIKSTSDLTKAFADPNYATALIDTTLVFTENISIPENVEILISENGGVVLQGNLEINGLLTNNGKLAFSKEDASQITLLGNGSINNNSNIYFNNIAQDNCISGTGNIYTRTKLLAEHIQNFPTTVEYNTISSYGIEPSFDLIIGSETIDKYKNYSISYKNNKAAGQTGEANIVANNFSEKIYGKVTKHFNITKGDVTIYNYDDLIKALNTYNFNNVYLGNSITRTIKNLKLSRDDVKIVIHENTTLNCGDFKIFFNKQEDASGKFSIENNGTIITKHAFNFDKYSGTGKIYGYASTTKDLGELTYMCHNVYVTDNLTEQGRFDMKSYHFNTVVDLCGYTIRGSLKIRCQYKTLKITSTTGTKGTIESYGYANSIVIDYLNSQYCLILENLILNRPIDYGNFNSSYISTSNLTIK